MTYEKFIEESRAYYKTLPYESNPLYTRYVLDLSLDKAAGILPVADSSVTDRIVSMAKSRTKMRFDAIITEGSAASYNGVVRVADPKDAYAELLENKLFKSSEDKLAAYVNTHASRLIAIDAPRGFSGAINLLFVGDVGLSSQVLLHASERSNVTLTEIHLSSGRNGALHSSLHEIMADKGARVELNALHNESAESKSLSMCKAVASDDARVSVNGMYCGGSATKSKTMLHANGTGSFVHSTELVFGTGSQAFDIGTDIINMKQRTTASLDSGAILDGTSRCVFKGYAKVEDGSKGASSKITERGMLLNELAHMDALPDMAIDYSNDVKATHSASTAPIDREILFYLNSRGLDDPSARGLLISAFITKYISRMADQTAKEVAMSTLLHKFETGETGTIPEVSARNVWVADSA